MKSQQTKSKNYWLMKSEPDVFSIEHLEKDKSTWWEGVRNYQARNFMLNDMNVGDQVLFYHSNAEPPGIAGLAIVNEKAKPDASQFNKKSKYFAPKATTQKPIWHCVQISFKKKFKNFITLTDLKTDSHCSSMLVVKPGQRLSIQPVSKEDFLYLVNKGD